MVEARGGPGSRTPREYGENGEGQLRRDHLVTG
jgi:hypothetical protein